MKLIKIKVLMHFRPSSTSNEYRVWVFKNVLE